MAKFMLLHYGFEPPTDEIMEKWGEWFGSIAPIQTDQAGFMGGKEITDEGTADLPWGADSITGYNIIEADDMDAAVEIAKKNPYIKGIRVYELRTEH